MVKHNIYFVALLVVFISLFAVFSVNYYKNQAGKAVVRLDLSKNFPYVDAHVHATSYYYPFGTTQNLGTLFNDINADKIILFGSYPEIVNNYIASNGKTDDQIVLEAYRMYPQRVYPFAMSFTPGQGDYMNYLNENVKGKGFVGIGELGLGVDIIKGGHVINYPALSTLDKIEDLINFSAQNHLILFLHTQRLDDTYNSNPREINWGILDNHRDVIFLSPHFIQFHAYEGFKDVVEKKLSAHCNLYADISPPDFKMDKPIKGWQQGWAYLLNKYPERFMIGSDSQPDPTGQIKTMGATYGRQDVVDFLKTFGLSDTNIRKIMYQNAVDLVEKKRFEKCSAVIPVPACGNGKCESEELINAALGTEYSCPKDCCGNGKCDAGEVSQDCFNKYQKGFVCNDCVVSPPLSCLWW